MSMDRGWMREKSESVGRTMSREIAGRASVWTI